LPCEPSMCGGDAALCQIYFDHLLLLSSSSSSASKGPSIHSANQKGPCMRSHRPLLHEDLDKQPKIRHLLTCIYSRKRNNFHPVNAIFVYDHVLKFCLDRLDEPACQITRPRAIWCKSYCPHRRQLRTGKEGTLLVVKKGRG